MKEKEFVPQPKYLENKCPYCYEKLDSLETMKRKMKKVCKCKKCGRLIDERFISR